MSMAASVSVSVPIWLGLIRMALAMCLSMPSCRIFVLVTNRSSPPLPGAFGHAVLDGDYGILAGEIPQVLGKLGRREAALFRLELVASLLEELRARHIQTEIHILPDLVSGLLDRADDGLQRLLV